MAKLYARAASGVTGAELYNAIVVSTPALQNSGLPFVALDGDPSDLDNLDSRMVGDMLYNNIDLANQFVPALLNKVIVSFLQSKYYENPWSALEKGYYENGDIVEEVFIRMAKPKQFSPKQAEEEVFKRELPDVSTAFHKMNYQHYYKRSISIEQLRSAFSSWNELQNFVQALIENLYTSANYDLRQTMMYLVARSLLNGFVATENITAITNDQTARDAVAAVRGVSNLLTEMLPDYNYFQVPNYSNYADQVIIIDARVEGKVDVSVLAAAYNMDKAEFLSMHRLTTPGFGALDNARLALLFEGDSSYVAITDAEKTLLNAIPFAVFDRSWFQFYDKLNMMVNIGNPEGLYWNYDYHVWKILGVSPFANAVAFTTTAPSVTSVTVSPSAVTVSPGQQAQLSATVVTTGFAKQTVTWSSSNNKVTVDQSGKVTVLSDATGTATIKATSTADSTKSGSCTVTVATS